MTKWQNDKLANIIPKTVELGGRSVAYGADAERAYREVCTRPYLNIPPADRARIVDMIAVVKNQSDRDRATAALNRGDMGTLGRILRKAGAF